MVKLDIVDDKSNQRWKQFTHDNSPDCKHCAFVRAEESIPVDNFIMRGLKTELGIALPDRTISKINVVRGRYGDCIGWTY